MTARIKLSPRQAAKLRQLARIVYELEERHAARRAAITTQRDYVQTLRLRLEKLPRTRDAALSECRSDEKRLAVESRFDAEEKRLREEIESARGEFDKLRSKLEPIVEVSGPLHTLLDRVRTLAGLSEIDAGVSFGRDSGRARDVEVVGVA